MKQLQKDVRRECEETRKRLIDAAAATFAEFGFGATTTRQICVRARANAAAVNYHFGDKLGLYTAVLRSVLDREEERVAQHALLALPPEAALRGFIVLMFQNLTNVEDSDRYSRLMAHEMSQSTPALAFVVEALIRPRALLLCEIVSRLTGRSPRSVQTRLCAHSVIGQVVHYMHARPVLKLLWPEWRMTEDAKGMLVEHITNFSLAALRVLDRKPRTVPRRRSSARGRRYP